MILALLLAVAQQAQPATPPTKPDPYRPAPATIVAEPIALFIAAADRERDGRTTFAEFKQALVETTSADPPWMNEKTGEYGVGYIRYSDWALRWLGDRNAVPTPFELDRNGDNRVSFDEFSERMLAIFARFDADKDGAVTRAELLTIRNSALGRPERERERRDRR